MNANLKRERAQGEPAPTRPATRRSRPLVPRILLLAAAAALAGPAAAQSGPARGKLLVATPEIGDSSWAETVMLLLHHDSNGTLGVAINRPTFVAPSEVEPTIGELSGYEGNVYRGGPIAPTRLIYLVRDPPAGLIESPPILDGVYAGGDLELLPRIAQAVDGEQALRLYAGHAEWVAGQLEREIADNRWTIVDGSAERVFAAHPERLWGELQGAGEELLVGVGGGRRTAPVRIADVTTGP